ncbi:XdhC family protein [Flavobacteriaceae bacterium M23B6Z8]
MTHELLKIVNSYKEAKANGIHTVLATVVALKGSSYRRPGVRMLITENGKLTGAVSGGCVEKEIVRQSKQVFESGVAKMMLYDGRYRLGCEGILYILIEPFEPDASAISIFEDHIKNRKKFNLQSFYALDDTGEGSGRTQFVFSDRQTSFLSASGQNSAYPTFETFEQSFKPLFRLVIIGSEHDAVQLCSMASLLGWDVCVIASVKDPSTTADFPGISKLRNEDPDTLDASFIDHQTAVVLMTHSFVNDLKYLYRLSNTNPCYLGLLGPSSRREKIFHSFIEQFPQAETTFFDRIYGPAGLHLGAETPQEIAIAIISEILSVTRNVQPLSLKDKKGSIHSSMK